MDGASPAHAPFVLFCRKKPDEQRPPSSIRIRLPAKVALAFPVAAPRGSPPVSRLDRRERLATVEEDLALVAVLIAPNDLNPLTQPVRNQTRRQKIQRLLRGECHPADLGDVYFRDC